MKYVFDENREIITLSSCCADNAMLCIIVHSKHASEATSASASLAEAFGLAGIRSK